MKPLLLCTSLFFLASLVACATNSRDYIPSLSNSDQAAHVTFLHNFRKKGRPTKITVDGAVVARIAPGRYVTVTMDSGVRLLGIAGSETSLELNPGEQYYFLISSAQNAAKLKRIDKATARAAMRSYKAVL